MSYAEHSAEGIAILLWAAHPAQPEKLATPFFHAAAASVRLLVPGVADALRASPRVTKTIGDNLREAVEHGAVLLACTEALHMYGLDDKPLITECGRRGGAVQFMGRALNLHWRTLVF